MTFDNQAIQKIQAELGKRVEKAAIHLTNAVKVKLNRSQPYHITTGPSGKHYHGEDPSLPGEPPKKITGFLQRSITYEMGEDKLSAKVGTNLNYGRHLELGTVNMAPRPYLRSTLKEEAARIDQILQGK